MTGFSDPSSDMRSNPQNSLYARYGKRLFDSVVACTGLCVLSPVLAVLALLVKLSSAGPVFFRQQRVGCGGKSFRILKFRSMYLNAEQQGLPITAGGDSRITPFGRVMRRFKLDELPQLWNVLKGDMSFVGPRPEVPEYVQHYSSLQRQVLLVRPGITDLASLAYRQEEQILADQADPDRYYREVVLPHKLNLNLEYIQRISFPFDLSLMLHTMACVFSPS